MDFFEAYAHQVVSYHPVKQRDELYAEIYDELCEEFADRQAENPGLTEKAFLNEYRQHPMKYATELAADSSPWLIGPRFYFSFLTALKTVLSIVVIFHVVAGAVLALVSGEPWSSFWGSMASIPNSLLWAGVSVLGVFVALEKSGDQASWLDKWDAGDLKPLDSHQPISRFETSFDLAFSAFALLLILDIIKAPGIVHHDGEWVRDWSVNLPEPFWVIACILLVFDIAFSIYRLGSAFWTRRLRLVTVADNVLWLGLLAYAIGQPNLISIDHAAASEFIWIVEKATKGGLLVAFVIIAWDTLSHAWRLAKGGRAG